MFSLIENVQKNCEKIIWFFILEKLLNGYFNWNERKVIERFGYHLKAYFFGSRKDHHQS